MLIKSKEIEYVEKQARKLNGFVPADFVPEAPRQEEPPAVEAGAAEPPAADTQAEEEKQAQAALREAYERGLSEGVVRGGDAEKKRLVTAIRSMERTLNEVLTLRQKLFERLEPEVLDLALSIAEKVIHQEVKTNREVFFGVLREAVRNILDREGMKIRLNPNDYEYLIEAKPDFLNSFEGVKNPVIEKDGTVERGGAIVESLFGEVDARLDMQLAEVRSALNQKG